MGQQNRLLLITVVVMVYVAERKRLIIVRWINVLVHVAMVFVIQQKAFITAQWIVAVVIKSVTRIWVKLCRIVQVIVVVMRTINVNVTWGKMRVAQWIAHPTLVLRLSKL